MVFPSLGRHSEEEALISDSQKEGMKFSLLFQSLYGEECDFFMDSSLMDAVGTIDLINHRLWSPVLSKSLFLYIYLHPFMKMKRNIKGKVGFSFITVDYCQTLK